MRRQIEFHTAAGVSGTLSVVTGSGHQEAVCVTVADVLVRWGGDGNFFPRLIAHSAHEKCRQGQRPVYTDPNRCMDLTHRRVPPAIACGAFSVDEIPHHQLFLQLAQADSGFTQHLQQVGRHIPQVMVISGLGNGDGLFFVIHIDTELGPGRMPASSRR